MPSRFATFVILCALCALSIAVAAPPMSVARVRRAIVPKPDDWTVLDTTLPRNELVHLRFALHSDDDLIRETFAASESACDIFADP